MLATAVVVGVIIVLIAGVVFFGYTSAKAGKEGEAGVDPRVEHLSYPVPDGQDPAVLMAALTEAGYDAASEVVEGKPHVVVACPAGRDRERAHVRQVIRDTGTTGMTGTPFEPEQVVFQDER